MMTRSEFEALPEYSCTLPTGTTIGKRWKRRIPYMDRIDPPNDWYMGEYVECYKDGEIGIEWSRILLPEPTALPASEDPALDHPQAAVALEAPAEPRLPEPAVPPR